MSEQLGGSTERRDTGYARMLQVLSPTASESHNSAVDQSPKSVATATICDECEELLASLDCEDCGLVYCMACDKRRHRKGKLLFHQRKRLEVHVMPMQLSLADPNQWDHAQVTEWLCDHELDVFVHEATLHGIDGAFLMSPQMETFVEAQSAASRGHKKKLLREIQKLKSDGAPGPATSAGATASPSRLLTEAVNGSFPSPGSCSSASAPASVPVAMPLSVAPPNERNSLRRMGVNLRVNVDAQPAPAPEKHFSPVTALRARATHGQRDEARGRVRRTSSALYSELVLDDNASTPIVNVNKSVERRCTPASLQIDLSSERRLNNPALPRLDLHGVAPVPVPVPSSSSSSSHRDLRSIRQALGGLDMDMIQVKKDGRAVEASFDFSAEGRLQTQGFEIDTKGIANAPFPNQDATASGKRKSAREHLVILNELGHGASGKVYKALYVPTFKLVAIKVIRVFDQKKRHQMVRELKSLYFNWAPIDDTSGTAAACDELVIFYDAYTNPEIGSVSIVLEYMDGGSLEDFMQQSGKCDENEIANIAYCALKGLAFLHDHHQLHRDIKLSNMLINRDGQVKISDFGISRDLESTLAKAATFTGTLLYMAPERISGGLYSYPSDIWSFGLALMACAIGKLPVPTKEGYWGVVHAVQEQPSPSLREYGDGFSPELCEFVDLCLRKNPMTRPSASQLLDHAFIKRHYVPGVRQSIDVTARSGSQQTREKQMAELDAIAKHVRIWWQDHGDAMRRAPPPHGDEDDDQYVLHHVPHAQKMHTLAKQLHLPVEIVADKFTFMEAAF